MAGETSHTAVNLSLLPIVVGVLLVCREASLTWEGLYYAVISSAGVGKSALRIRRFSGMCEVNGHCDPFMYLSGLLMKDLPKEKRRRDGMVAAYACPHCCPWRSWSTLGRSPRFYSRYFTCVILVQNSNLAGTFVSR